MAHTLFDTKEATSRPSLSSLTDQVVNTEFRPSAIDAIRDTPSFSKQAPNEHPIPNPEHSIERDSKGKFSIFKSSKTPPGQRASNTEPRNYLKRFNRFIAYLSDRWAFEIFGCVLGFAALIAILVILATNQHRPLVQKPMLMSINSMIAVFTAIMKTSLMFPVAEGKILVFFSNE